MSVDAATERTQATTGSIPVIDLAAYRAGEPAAAGRAAQQLREALTDVGFFSIVNHGIPWGQVTDIYEQAARYHALAEETKVAHSMDARRMGYSRLGGAQHDERKPALNAAFFMARPGSSRNQFPDEAALPGFRAAVTAYYEAMDRLGHELLPLYARALELPPEFFDGFFQPALATLRLTHYPPMPAEEDQWGIDPHTDGGFMTMLPSNPVAGLWLGLDGEWFEPAQQPESFVVNSGDMLRRWSNDRFRSTMHRVLNTSGRERYAIPFFFDPRVDTVIECLPTCWGPEDPPHHEPIVYRDYLRAFMARGYPSVREDAAGPTDGG